MAHFPQYSHAQIPQSSYPTQSPYQHPNIVNSNQFNLNVPHQTGTYPRPSMVRANVPLIDQNFQNPQPRPSYSPQIPMNYGLGYNVNSGYYGQVPQYNNSYNNRKGY